MNKKIIISKVMEKFSKKPNSKELREILLKFFKENPKLTDVDVHSLADKLGIEHSKLEGQIYKLLVDVLKKKDFQL